jgi:hypothetical protein
MELAALSGGGVRLSERRQRARPRHHRYQGVIVGKRLAGCFRRMRLGESVPELSTPKAATSEALPERAGTLGVLEHISVGEDHRSSPPAPSAVAAGDAKTHSPFGARWGCGAYPTTSDRKKYDPVATRRSFCQVLSDTLAEIGRWLPGIAPVTSTKTFPASPTWTQRRGHVMGAVARRIPG